MTFQPVPNTFKFALVHNCLNELIVNTFHFSRQGFVTPLDLEDGATLLATAWVNDIMIHLNSNVQFLRVEARGLRQQIDITATIPITPPVGGGRNQELMALNVAFCVTHTTGLSGRSARGRTYFGGLDRADVTQNTISQARADGFVTGLTSLRDLMDNAGWSMVVVNRQTNKVIPPTASTIPVTGFRYADRVVDSQRRRLPGRGR